jgi:hypothetical protein
MKDVYPVVAATGASPSGNANCWSVCRTVATWRQTPRRKVAQEWCHSFGGDAALIDRSQANMASCLVKNESRIRKLAGV